MGYISESGINPKIGVAVSLQEPKTGYNPLGLAGLTLWAGLLDAIPKMAAAAHNEGGGYPVKRQGIRFSTRLRIRCKHQ